MIKELKCTRCGKGYFQDVGAGWFRCPFCHWGGTEADIMRGTCKELTFVPGEIPKGLAALAHKLGKEGKLNYVAHRVG